MNTDELEKVMTLNYSQVFQEMLLSALKSHPKLTPDYLSQSVARQREIEEEIKERSSKMAVALVGKLKAKGYLADEPPDDVLKGLILAIMQEFGVSQ